MKAYTDLEQSKTLAEILPIESADLWWNETKNYPEFIKTYHEYLSVSIPPIPCWSLAALLGVLPKGTNINTPSLINAHYCCWNNYVVIDGTNPVDACYEMIIKLHQLKML